MTKSSKSIWLWLIGGLFMLGVIGSIFGKPSEATPDNQPATTEKSFEVKSVSNEKEEYQIVHCYNLYKTTSISPLLS